jgi:hypothetical protein
MKRILSHRPSAAMLVACLSLFVAMTTATTGCTSRATDTFDPKNRSFTVLLHESGATG